MSAGAVFEIRTMTLRSLLAPLLALAFWPVPRALSEWAKTGEFSGFVSQFARDWSGTQSAGPLITICAALIGGTIVYATRHSLGKYAIFVLCVFLALVALVSALAGAKSTTFDPYGFAISFGLMLLAFKSFAEIGPGLSAKGYVTTTPGWPSLVRLASTFILWDTPILLWMGYWGGFFGSSYGADAIWSSIRIPQLWQGLLSESGLWVPIQVLITLGVVEWLRRKTGKQNWAVMFTFLTIIGIANPPLTAGPGVPPVQYVLLTGLNSIVFYVMGGLVNRAREGASAMRRKRQQAIERSRLR